MDFNYESPITKIEQEIINQIVKTEEEKIMYEVKKAIGYSIEKEELIKALQYDRGQYEKGYNDGYNANKWIPVCERLPEESEEVLITCLNEVGVGWLNYNEWKSNDFTKAILKKVTAWQPLPDPYKAESEVEE